MRNCLDPSLAVCFPGRTARSRAHGNSERESRMYGYPVSMKHLAGAGTSREHAGFPCATNQASWLVTRIGMTDQKPEPRRHLTS